MKIWKDMTSIFPQILLWMSPTSMLFHLGSSETRFLKLKERVLKEVNWWISRLENKGIWGKKLIRDDQSYVGKKIVCVYVTPEIIFTLHDKQIHINQLMELKDTEEGY